MSDGLQVTAGVGGAMLDIRSWLPEHKAGRQSIEIEGREWPREVGATLAQSPRVLCLAPGEWLLVSDEFLPSSITSQVAAAVVSQGAVLVDATDGAGILTIRGSQARDVLSKGCGLDFHPAAFAVGRCARTRFAQMSLIIDHIDDAPSFALYVARSYLHYLADWIEDAAVEFNSGSKRSRT